MSVICGAHFEPVIESARDPLLPSYASSLKKSLISLRLSQLITIFRAGSSCDVRYPTCPFARIHGLPIQLDARVT